MKYSDIKNHNDLHYAVRNAMMSVNEALDLEHERTLLADKVMTPAEEEHFKRYECF